MKKLRYIFLILAASSLAFLTSCQDEEYADAVYEYVGFNSSYRLPANVLEGTLGSNSVVGRVDYGGTVDMTKVVSVTIDLDAASTAVLGTDFVIDGQTSLPFTISIPADTNFVEFIVRTIENDEEQPDRVAIFNITSTDAGIGIGHPLRDQWRLTIVDDDCPSELEGFWDSGNTCYDDDYALALISATDTNGFYQLNDIIGGYLMYAGIMIPGEIIEACGTILVVSHTNIYTGSLSFTFENGQVNADGSIQFGMTATWVSGAVDNCTVVMTPAL